MADAGEAGKGKGKQGKDAKVGLMKRVFSFKRRTSSTKFEVLPKERSDESDALNAQLDIGTDTDLGFHHPLNEDQANVIEDLFEAAGLPDGDCGEYQGTRNRKISLFSVYDGHGGHTCSTFARENLYKKLATLLWTGNYGDMVGSALHHSFKQTENEWCDGAKKRKDTAGACSTVVLVKGSKVYCGNAGDSKAILFNPRSGDPSSATNKIVLNDRHGAELKSERERIKKAGGTISPDGAVYGVLYPSRGFGDIDVKSDGKPVVIATPDGAGIDKWPAAQLDIKKTTFLVVASDGLWDFASDQSIMAITLRQPQRTEKQIATALIREARLGGSEDDITITVVKITFPDAGGLASVSE
eukprot:UC1_evm2s1690